MFRHRLLQAHQRSVRGHLAGDHVLRELARIVQDRIRRDEVFARYGGEEFVIVLPETSLAGAVALAENPARSRWHARLQLSGRTDPGRPSASAARCSKTTRPLTDLIQRADEKYVSSQAQRTINRVCS